MSPDQVSTFFALLALLALGLVVVSVASARLGLREEVSSVALPVALLVAVTSTAGSLYYSEVAHYTPCELCWYQRIAMYPLSLLLLVAVLRRDPGVRRYVIPQALAGAVIAAYHYQLQLFPGQGSTCEASNPCTFQWVEKLGFVSIPFMALCGFLAIAAMMAVAQQPTDNTPSPRPQPEGAS